MLAERFHSVKCADFRLGKAAVQAIHDEKPVVHTLEVRLEDRVLAQPFAPVTVLVREPQCVL